MTTPAARTAELIEAVDQYLVPVLVEKGFLPLPLTPEDRRTPSIKRAFPFGRHRRRHSHRIDQVEIQFDQHVSAAFRLNIGVVPLDGIAHSTGHIDPEDVWVQYLDRYAQLYEVPRSRTWFATERTSLFGRKTESARDLASRVGTLVTEIDAVFANDDASAGAPPHVRWV